MTPNSDFKITTLFDAEYLRNGTRYSLQTWSQWSTTRDLRTRPNQGIKGVISNNLDEP